jgi:hypothetical protein
MEGHSRNHCCRGKTIRITYSECLSVFLPQLSGMQIASFVCSIILSCVACLAVPCYLINVTILGEIHLLNIKRVLIFSTNFSEKCIFFTIIQ